MPSFFRDGSLDMSSVAIHNFCRSLERNLCSTLSRIERYDVKASVLNKNENSSFFSLPYKILHQLKFWQADQSEEYWFHYFA